MKKKALITGVTGQDGSYLAEFLLEKGYEVHGIKRRSSSFNSQRVDHIYKDPHDKQSCFFMHYGDLTDTSNLVRIIKETEPDEIYNLGAQSHVAVSFDSPEYTADVDALGALRLLEAIRLLNLEKRHASIRPLRRNFSAWFKKFLRQKLRHFIPEALMRLRNFMPIGPWSIIEKLMEYSRVTEFFLIMNLSVVGKLLSLVKSLEVLLIFPKVFRNACILAT